MKSALHESVTLPLLFLTVALAGGFRLLESGRIEMIPPPLMSLVLAALLLGALAQGRILRLDQLLAGRATALESLSGFVLVASLYVGTAQLLNGLVPEYGVLGVAGNLFLAVLLTSTLAAAPTGPRLLRSLAVTFAWALLIKYVLLAGLATPDPTWSSRVVHALLRGASLGSLPVEPAAPIVGYVMLGATILYLGGALLLLEISEKTSKIPEDFPR